MKFIKRFLRDEKGQALPLFALLAVVIIGFSALAIDWGMHYTSKASYQKAADAAALAAVLDHPGGTIGENSPVGLSMKKIAKDVIAANQKDIDSSAIKVSFPKENQVKVEIELPFRKFLGGVAGFETPKFTEEDGKKTSDEVIAIAQKKSIWDGFALPFMNIDNQFGIKKEIVLRDKNGENSAWRDWIDGNLEFKDFKKQDPITDFRINPFDGLNVRPGAVNVYSKDIVTPILDMFPNEVFIFSIDKDILSTINKKGIAVLDRQNEKKGATYFPIDGDNKFNIAPYAKLDPATNRYIPWREGDKEEDKIEQIVLWKITSIEMGKQGNSHLTGTIEGQYSLTDEIETQISNTIKSRLVE